MNITQEQLQQLARIYNTLMNISTRGEDTFIMADCLRALEQVIKEIDGAANAQMPEHTVEKVSSITPEVVED